MAPLSPLEFLPLAFADLRKTLGQLGGRSLPLWKMMEVVSWDDYPIYIIYICICIYVYIYIMGKYGKIKNVWNHQPVMHAVMPISLSAYILILLISARVRGVHDRDYSLLPREFCETWQCQRPSLSSYINLEQSFAHKFEFIIMINWLMDRCAWNHYQY